MTVQNLAVGRVPVFSSLNQANSLLLGFVNEKFVEKKWYEALTSTDLVSLALDYLHKFLFLSWLLLGKSTLF